MAVFDVILHEKFTDLKQLLESNPACANSIGWHGMTPLHHAVTKNNPEIVDLLLKHAANVNQANAFGESPLHLACQAANLRFVYSLVENGADLTALDSAGKSCIHHAARSGSVLKLHFLTASGLNLKKRDNRGQTALHVAAEYGNIDVCEYLLRKKRFSPDVRDNADMTPLHLAAKFAQCEVAWSLESKSPVSMTCEPDARGKTPIDYASEGSSPRHFWLKSHLKYWQASRCPASQPPKPWAPWCLLLLSPSFGIFLVVLAFNHLTTLFAAVATLGIIVFFNLWSFSRHRLQHISAIPNPALAGFFSGSIIQSVVCYFVYIVPQIWPDLFWTSFAVVLFIASLITLRKLLSDPGITTANRISEFGETMTILDVAKGVISESDFCTVCEIVMPELTKHCRLCEVCVICLDHHCVFLNGCVAKKNHRAFVIFMLEVMLACTLFVRAAASYLSEQVFIGGESSSLSEAMGNDVFVSVLLVINIFGVLYVFLLTFFQFKIITDGGTTYYSSDGRPLHRTWQDLRNFGRVSWSSRIKIFVQFLLGEYSFYKAMQMTHAHRLV